jgi:hypothetical protein
LKGNGSFNGNVLKFLKKRVCILREVIMNSKVCFSPDRSGILLWRFATRDIADSGKPACLQAGSSKKKAPVLQLMLS